MKEPVYYDADRWGIFSDNYEEKKKKNNAQFYLHIAKDMLDFYLTEVPFLWGNILPQRGLVCLAGESDCGKSAFLRQFAIAFCATSSERFLGMDLHNNYFYHKKALYISTEDEQLAFGPVMRKQCRELGIEYSKLDNLYVVFENDKIYNYDPLLVKYIDIYPYVHVVGTRFYDGVVNFVTYKGNMPSMTFGGNVRIVNFKGVSFPRAYTCHTLLPGSGYPDYRQTVYWYPLAGIEPGGSFDDSVKIPDYPGTFTIVVEGFDEAGGPVRAKSSFVIK